MSVGTAAPAARTRRRRAGFIERTIKELAEATERTLYAEELARADGLLQPLDPRVKLVGLLALILAAALARNILVILALFGLGVLLALLSRVPLRTLAARAWAGSRGRRTLPSARIRSSTSTRSWRGTSGTGGSMKRSYMS